MNTIKKIIIVVCLLLINVFSSAWSKSADDAQIIVYYFLTNVRCSSCYKIEQYTKEAVEQYFGNELKSGMLVFKPINIEKKVNRHFIKDYQLYSKAVVISMVNGGREIKYKNLTKVWQYLRDKQKFYDYIKTETSKYLDEVK